MYYQNPLILSLPTGSPSPEPLPEPVNLVSHQGQTIVYIGIFLLIVTLIIIVGMINQNIEKALIISVLLSLILIPILWLI
ncbi:hypothetical protein [Roseofilum sp. Guam]|uniref:hypothetical protein n=1 Tax=Roseofilum sp. Guam TaxID=2821502 RepID=UPI001B1C9A6A|nr:hypothetical protein [Roseofilum sp. Guam]MBP0029100.1 hypothetical protein [Roseofilum sp. Guam]